MSSVSNLLSFVESRSFLSSLVHEMLKAEEKSGETCLWKQCVRLHQFWCHFCRVLFMVNPCDQFQLFFCHLPKKGSLSCGCRCFSMFLSTEGRSFSGQITIGHVLRMMTMMPPPPPPWPPPPWKRHHVSVSVLYTPKTVGEKVMSFVSFTQLTSCLSAFVSLIAFWLFFYPTDSVTCIAPWFCLWGSQPFESVWFDFRGERNTNWSRSEQYKT